MEQKSSDIVVCLLCKDKLKYSGSTSNMIKPPRTTRPIEYAELKEDADMETATKASIPSTSAQPTLIKAIMRAQPYKNDSNKKKELDNLVVRMIVEDLQPLSVVEDKGFKKLVNGLNPRYDLPSCREIGRTLLSSIDNREVERVHQELEKEKHIPLTTDIWTSRQTKAFITVTAHYISPEWILKSVVLDTVHMVKSHTADNIAEELRFFCSKWGISYQICSIVTDNAANMIAAIKQMDIRHLQCFAHSLNLVVQNSIKNTEDVQKLKKK